MDNFKLVDPEKLIERLKTNTLDGTSIQTFPFQISQTGRIRRAIGHLYDRTPITSVGENRIYLTEIDEAKQTQIGRIIVKRGFYVPEERALPYESLEFRIHKPTEFKNCELPQGSIFYSIYLDKEKVVRARKDTTGISETLSKADFSEIVPSSWFTKL